MAGKPAQVPTKSPPETYLRNMALLWRFDPVLAMRIDAIPDDARAPVEPTRSGDFTAASPGPDDRPAYLHSRYNPVAEAEKFAAGVDVEDYYCYFVSGFGLGYHLRALRRRIYADAIIVVAEPDLRLVAAALAAVDLREVLADGKLLVLNRANKAQVHERLQAHTALLMLGAKLVSHPASQRVAADFHGQMRGLLTEFVAYARMTIMTLVANARITCHNIANNIGKYAATTSVGILENRFRGVPAIVVSAGPSLKRNLAQLAEAKGRAIICAVQTTLKMLLERGITPDFVTSLDYHEVSRQYFEGAVGLENVHLVAEPKATWHVLDSYPGPISLLDNSFARLLIGDDLAPRAALPPGATVAHLAFYLARYMGCDPIIFVGQDLAYTGYVYYSPGMEIHRTWRSEINRFNPMETKEWERTVRMGQMLRKTTDNAGRKIYTDDLLFTYLEQFERDFSQTDARIINATEGGARIRGAEPIPLTDVLARFCTRPLPPESFAYREETRWYRPEILPAVGQQLRQRIAEVDHMQKLCAEMRGVLEKLQDLTHDPDRFNRLLVRVDELRAQVNQAQHAYQVINATSQLSQLRRFSADRRMGAARAEGVELAKQQLKRDLEFVISVHDAADDVRSILTEALDRVEKAIAAESVAGKGGAG